MTNTPVQIFCDICSKGVLVHKSSMYKCRVCGKQVCNSCWVSKYNKCRLCAKSEIEKENKIQEIKNKAVVRERENKERTRKQEEAELIRLENRASNTGCFILIIAFLIFLPGMPLLVNKVPWWLTVGTAVILAIYGGIKMKESSRYTDARKKLSK
ncbi:MAG: hypothetical protein KAR44_09830 [Candidatus Aegiribacteria sp.]|nr:hypothetical protein [Candidatus Aegiribacteria sp.]